MHQSRRIRVRGVPRAEADLKKLSRALIALARAQAEKEAQAERGQPTKPPKAPRRRA